MTDTGSRTFSQRILGGISRLRQSRITVAIVVCFALFTDILVYGMVVPIFTEEVLGFSVLEVSVR